MNTKHIFILLLVILASVMVMACSEIQTLPTALALENNIKEAITSKGDDYDFLNDEEYMGMMHELANLFIEHDIIEEKHYKIGNLNDDKIPELVVFRQRDPENVEDQGYLEVYGFVSDKYRLLDRVPMNYDNTNYELSIGKIGHDQNGILLNNQVGTQSGITYGFIIDEMTLVNILNEKKINLESINTNNEIKDIDNDGILEFSIYTIDPESIDQTIENSDKIKYWYKWNGKDGAELVKYEKINKEISKEINQTDKNVLKEAERLYPLDRLNFIKYLENNKDSLSIMDTSSLLREYFNSMLAESKSKETVIKGLFTKYQINNNHNYLYDKYSLSLERLNDAAYLNRPKILNSEEELKENLINNLKLGYNIIEDNGEYSYSINYKFFLDSFGENILKEYRDFIKILGIHSSDIYMKNNTLMIPMEELANRIILIDNFRMTYPYSEFINQLDPIYNDYLNAFLYGSSNSPVFDKESNLIDEEVLIQYKDIEERYADTNLANIVSDYIKQLKINGHKINDDIREKFSHELK